MIVEDIPEASFNTLKGDTQFLRTFLHKYVTVQLKKEVTVCGFVQSMDPVTHSVILQTSSGDSFRSIIIPGHALLDMTLTPVPEGITPPSQNVLPGSNLEDSEETLPRKKKLKAWFKKNLIPVTEKGEELVVGSATLLPPYSVTDIFADNTSVGMQIKKIIENMPADFK